jgi:SAM-dependent methyltransferase
MVPSTNGAAAEQGNPPSPTTSLVSISSSEYEHWFRREHDRRFHNIPEAPYPFPCDDEELERLDVQHSMLRTLLHSHYVGPVADVLQSEADAPQKVVLDLGSGSGQWADDMALLFAHVHFCAVDLAPTGSRYPQANVDYECYDLFAPDGFRNEASSVSLVHARFISFGITNYPRLIDEASRVLRAGGLFLSGEYDSLFITADDSELQTTAPSIWQVANLVETCLAQLDIHPVAHQIAGWLREGGRFVDVNEVTHRVPVGAGWHGGDSRMDQIGASAVRMLFSWAGTIRPLLLNRSGQSQEVIDALLENFKQEVQTVHVYMVYRVIHARRA